jgi:NADPH-dependent glutamate synthase beta subunit-like oxidoreductase/Pyruvate/2-oxoacid:ferredoxin oxidoreductase delta subunit
MKPAKDRLPKVIVLGATPAGLMATNKLGELGIPVTLVDPDPDLDQKLSCEEWRLASDIALNHAHRPGLLRILRNPIIRCVLPGQVTSLKHTPQGFRARIKRAQTFVDPDRCTACGRCKEVCPVQMFEGNGPVLFNGRGSLPGRTVIQKRPQPLCQAHCPLGVNAQAYIALARTGRYLEALEVIRRDNVLPGICGRVCTHPCEDSCRRKELDEPIAIRDIKRFLADYELSNPGEPELPGVAERSEKIAVIGSGPAGLAAAADMARLGYRVTVFEKEATIGGLLRYGIGPHRLPRDILEHDLEYIKKLGVTFKTSYPVDAPDGLNNLKEAFNAVIMATGAPRDRKLDVPGEELDGVEGCLSFLKRLYQGTIEVLREEVAVIGDGNAAVDLARVLRRLGARVTILSWFPRDLIPADEKEMEAALEEGISLVDQTQVIAFSGSSGRLNRLKCRPTRPGNPDAQGIPWPVIVPGSKPFELKFDRAFVAIGQVGSELDTTDTGLVHVGVSDHTGISKIYAAGDVITGPSSVVEAMAAGRAAALSVHLGLTGQEAPVSLPSRPADMDFAEIPDEIPHRARPTMPERDAHSRSNDFSEVALGLSEAQVSHETERCLQCGICSECLFCVEACGLIGAINHRDQPEEIIVHAGAVIVADPKVAPGVKGEDVIRAYGPKAARQDVYASITRGFAAAAKAMVLLGGASQLPKGHGVTFSPPEPELSPEIRVGVFVCRCNDSFGWLDRMTEYVSGLTDQEDVVHAQVVGSACVYEETAKILRAIRAKGVTRVVLASCVCCPLDFVCNACTDQRSRLKDNLFKGTGISRSMVETCNLRGEALRHLVSDPTVALRRFAGLIERAIHRVKRLRPLPNPARTYNFTTAVLGDSEATVNSAEILASAGLEVFKFGSPGDPFQERPSHPNIHCFEDSEVKGLSGTLGKFQVFVESKGITQVLQVGAVILGENHRRMIPYFPQEGLPAKLIASAMQKRDLPGVPFLYPGGTSIAGLFLANPKGIHVSERRKGAAAAVLAMAAMPRGPRQSKGYTVVVDHERCRACGRCHEVCFYQAVSFRRNSAGGWHAVVDEALCKGCGICISVCPSNAADSPYRDQAYLEQIVEEVLAYE